MKNLMRIALVLLVAAFIGACGGGSDNPEAVAEEFLTHLGNQDYEKAKELGTENTVAMITMIESMSGMAEEMGGEGQEEVKGLPDDFDMKGCEVDGDKATCTYTAEGKEESIDMLKVDGKWKVDMKKEQ